METLQNYPNLLSYTNILSLSVQKFEKYDHKLHILNLIIIIKNSYEREVQGKY